MKKNKTLIFDPCPKITPEQNKAIFDFFNKKALENLKGDIIIFDSSGHVLDSMTVEQKIAFKKQCNNRMNRKNTK